MQSGGNIRESQIKDIQQNNNPVLYFKSEKYERQRRLKSCSIFKGINRPFATCRLNPRPEKKKNPIFVIMDISKIISTIWMRNTE